MTKAYLMGFTDYLRGKTKNPFPVGEAYWEYQQGQEDAWECLAGNEETGMEKV